MLRSVMSCNAVNFGAASNLPVVKLIAMVASAAIARRYASFEFAAKSVLDLNGGLSADEHHSSMVLFRLSD